MFDNHEKCCCSETANAPEIRDVKELGIYEKTRDTRDVLLKTLELLNVFKAEVCGPWETEGMCFDLTEPTCFKEEVERINDLAYAIKGDLTRLIETFR